MSKTKVAASSETAAKRGFAASSHAIR